MPEVWTPKFSYVTGVAQTAQIGALAMVSDKLASQQIVHTFPLIYNNGKWFHAQVYQLDFTTVSMTAAQSPLKQAVYLGLHGQTFFFGSGDEHEETIQSSNHSPAQIGMMRSIRNIHGVIFATGMRRQVYRRNAPDKWEYVGVRDGIKDPSTVTSFEAIDGFGPDDLYAVGRDGEIWSSDNGDWTALPSPTNVILTGVCCAADGAVYACGRSGMILKGRRDEWRVVDHGVTKQDFWSIVCFDGRIFLSTSYQLFELRNDSLIPLTWGSQAVRSCFHLSVGGDALWSFGAKDVMALQGDAWTRID
jgi:hypothetical protein